MQRWCTGPVCLSWILLATLTAVAADRPPNVILILTDDQGSVDAGCYGATDLITPNIDRLAEQGVRFTQFCAAAPVCSPSRAAVLTGRVPQRAGVPGNVSSHRGRSGMPSAQVTIAELLGPAGYATGHVGKWHLGYTAETMPNSQGFDESFGHMGGCIDNYSHFFYWNGPNRHDLWRNGEEVFQDGNFFPDLMVEECRAFIDDHREQPFFLYWAINVPHYPLQGSDKWRDRYRDLPHPRDKYAAFVSTMDEKIGEVLSHLDQRGLREQTLVVFQSDHGHSTEERTFGGGGSSGPYRGAKFSLYEGGLRVPAIVSWPGHFREGTVRGQLATGCDWFPTIAEVCGLPQPAHQLDGKSLVKVIQRGDADSPHSEFHWQSGKQWAVRRGDWKLIAHPRDTTQSSKNPPKSERPARFLANLANDVGEQQNLADDHPQIVGDLESRHETWVEGLQR